MVAMARWKNIPNKLGGEVAPKPKKNPAKKMQNDRKNELLRIELSMYLESKGFQVVSKERMGFELTVNNLFEPVHWCTNNFRADICCFRNEFLASIWDDAKLMKREKFVKQLKDIKAKPVMVVEINGGVWSMGRHNRPEGYKADIMKANLFQYHNVNYFQFMYDHLADGVYKQMFDL